MEADGEVWMWICGWFDLDVDVWMVGLDVDAWMVGGCPVDEVVTVL